MKKILLIMLSVVLAAVFCLTGCIDDDGDDGDKVTITFNAGSGKFSDDESTKTVEIDKGEKVTAPSSPTRSGYSFKEWNTASSGSGTKLESDTTHDNNTTYYAIWGSADPNKVTITFNPNGGKFSDNTTANKTSEINKGATVTAPTVTKEGSTFKEWNTNSSGTGTKLETTTTHDSNRTYYAIWEAANQKVTITFDANGGSFSGGATTTVEINKGATVTAPTITTPKSSSVFVEWNTDADGSGTTLTATTTHNADTTYYAIWGTLVFSLADYLTANAANSLISAGTLTSSTPKPLRTSTSQVTATINNDGSLSIPIRPNGVAHGLNIWVHGVSSGDLDLDLTEKHLVRVTGSVVGSPPSGELVQIRDDAGNVFTFDSNELSDDAAFTVSGILPSSWVVGGTPANTCIRIRTKDNQNTLFKVTSIEIIKL